MSNDPYAAPTADLENLSDSPVIPNRIMSAKGRLSVLSHLAHLAILMLVMVAILAVLGIIGAAVAGLSPESFTSLETIDFSNPLLIALMVLAAIAYIAVAVIAIILMIKRLHDRNHSGWWVLAVYIGSVIPFVGILASVGWLYIVLWPGQKTGNRFGGRRPTKGWEKVVGILSLILSVVVLIGAIAAVAIPMMMGPL